MAQKTACKVVMAIREEVAASLRKAEYSKRGLQPGQNRRSAAKSIERAGNLIEQKASDIWTSKQKEKILSQVRPLIKTLYSGGAPVDAGTIEKTKAILSALDRMTRRTC